MHRLWLRKISYAGRILEHKGKIAVFSGMGKTRQKKIKNPQKYTKMVRLSYAWKACNRSCCAWWMKLVKSVIEGLIHYACY